MNNNQCIIGSPSGEQKLAIKIWNNTFKIVPIVDTEYNEKTDQWETKSSKQADAK